MKKRFLAYALMCFSMALTLACKKDDKKEEEEETRVLKISIGNKAYTFTDDMMDVTVESNGELGIAFEKGNNLGSINCGGSAVGTYSWNKTNTQFMFEPGDFTPPQAFQQLYNDGLTVSAGNIKITKSGAVGQTIVGTFEIENAGSTNTETSAYIGASKITGTFNVTRDH